MSRECVNCGSRHSVQAVVAGGVRRWWCSLCGYWADRRKGDR